MKKVVMVIMTAVLLCGCRNTQNTADENSVQESKTPAENTVQTEEGSKEELPLITWEEKDLEIAGITREYEIWFFSDSHITLCDSDETAETIEYASERAKGFMNELGVSSDEIFSCFIDEANAEKPDLILFGGDIIDFPSEANITFLKSELDRLEVPYIFAMGNHDWTFPWEYMTEEGAAKYRPMLEDYMYGNFSKESPDGIDVKVSGNSYYTLAEFSELVILSVDDSSNQVAEKALTGLEEAYTIGKPVILMQHVPFSTEKLIEEAKKTWGNPVTIGMQVHGGIAPNGASASLWEKTHEDDSLIKTVLAGHVHFPYEEKLSDSTVQIITDAGFKGKAVKLKVSGK